MRKILGVIISDTRTIHFKDMVQDICNNGADILFLRDRMASEDGLRNAVEIIAAVKNSATRLFLNQAFVSDLLLDPHLDGWHIPEKTEIENLLPQKVGFQYGRSVHSIAASEKADHEGFDFVVAGTMFKSMSHPGKKPEGLRLLQDIKVTRPSLPVLAIGGITPENAFQCLQAGASGIVVHSGIFHAKDAGKATQAYRIVLDDYSDNQRQTH